MGTKRRDQLCEVLGIAVSYAEKDNHTHYSSDGHDELMNKTAKSKSTSHMGIRRRTQMGAKMFEQLCGVLGIEVSDDGRGESHPK